MAGQETTGVHDVFLKLYGSSPDDLMHVQTITFLKQPPQ